jgi:hypothetical protein
MRGTCLIRLQQDTAPDIPSVPLPVWQYRVAGDCVDCAPGPWRAGGLRVGVHPAFDPDGDVARRAGVRVPLRGRGEEVVPAAGVPPLPQRSGVGLLLREHPALDPHERVADGALDACIGGGGEVVGAAGVPERVERPGAVLRRRVDEAFPSNPPIPGVVGALEPVG